MVSSAYVPARNGPFTQTTQPVAIHTPTSYLTPGPLNLWEYHEEENGDGSLIRKSVPSTLMKTLHLDRRLGVPSFRYAKLICRLLHNQRRVRDRALSWLLRQANKGFVVGVLTTSSLDERTSITVFVHFRMVFSSALQRPCKACSVSPDFNIFNVQSKCFLCVLIGSFSLDNTQMYAECRGVTPNADTNRLTTVAGDRRV